MWVHRRTIFCSYVRIRIPCSCYINNKWELIMEKQFWKNLVYDHCAFCQWMNSESFIFTRYALSQWIQLLISTIISFKIFLYYWSNNQALEALCKVCPNKCTINDFSCMLPEICCNLKCLIKKIYISQPKIELTIYLMCITDGMLISKSEAMSVIHVCYMWCLSLLKCNL